VFQISSISSDYISLQALCQAFVDRPAWLGRPISHFIDYNLHNNSISEVLYSTAATNLHHFLHFWQHRELWPVQRCDWRERIWLFKVLRRYKCRYLDFFKENRSYPSRELFATPCCLYLKINVLDFFHNQRLHLFGSALSDFCESFRAVWTNWLLVPFFMIFWVTSIVQDSILYYYLWHSHLSEPLSSSWTMDILNGLKWTNFKIEELEKIKRGDTSTSAMKMKIRFSENYL
jgi:hypothetical protein